MKQYCRAENGALKFFRSYEHVSAGSPTFTAESLGFVMPSQVTMADGALAGAPVLKFADIRMPAGILEVLYEWGFIQLASLKGQRWYLPNVPKPGQIQSCLEGIESVILDFERKHDTSPSCGDLSCNRPVGHLGNCMPNSIIDLKIGKRNNLPTSRNEAKTTPFTDTGRVTHSKPAMQRMPLRRPDDTKLFQQTYNASRPNPAGQIPSSLHAEAEEVLYGFDSREAREVARVNAELKAENIALQARVEYLEGHVEVLKLEAGPSTVAAAPPIKPKVVIYCQSDEEI